MIEATAALRALLLRSVVADRARTAVVAIRLVDPQTPNAPTMARSAAVGAFIRLGFIRSIRAIRGENLLHSPTGSVRELLVAAHHAWSRGVHICADGTRLAHAQFLVEPEVN